MDIDILGFCYYLHKNVPTCRRENMKFYIVCKEDKSRQNDSILWNSPTQMTLSEKYDLEEYSPSFWILEQNLWSEMRYAVDNFLC